MEERERVNDKLKLYVGPGPDQVKSRTAAQLLRYSREQFDRFLHPSKSFWVPEKRCPDFIKFFEEIDRLKIACREFVLLWNSQKDLSNEEVYVINAVYDHAIKRMLSSKKLSPEKKTWRLLNEVLSRRAEMGA